MTDYQTPDEDLASAELLVAGSMQMLAIAAPTPRFLIAGPRYHRVVASDLPLVRSIIALTRLPRSDQPPIGAIAARELHTAVQHYNEQIMSVIRTVPPAQIGTLKGWRALARTSLALHNTSFRTLVDSETDVLIATALRVAASRRSPHD